MLDAREAFKLVKNPLIAGAIPHSVGRLHLLALAGLNNKKDQV